MGVINADLVVDSLEKSYVDRQLQSIKFIVGDQVWLKITFMKGVIRFVKKR